MRLKRLEIYGFKSFAERTVVVFDEGITGIVGPNGSGKSNLSDAVRWVLGEQSAKALRGGKMEDVIFNGTQKRKRMGYCEVSLVFDNEDHALSVDYTEVMITRRVYRSGEGDYYINKSACRLKDIVELFRDTGVGKEGYSIIGQGRIDEILSVKSEERRNVFSRPAAANIDQLVILASAAIPVTEPYLIDRIASIAALKGCDVLLCLNKCDLDPAEELYGIYSRSAIPVLRISAETGEGLDALRQAIAGKLNAFTGNSGVGKSSVLNALLPELHLPVGEVSKALGRGRHTTRHVELFPLGGGTYVIDTPGFSSFDTEEMDLELKEHLPETFPEFAPYVNDCRFTGCTHTKEKGCRVLQAVKDGDIPASRHRSYLRLFQELKDVQPWQKK